MSPSTQLVLHVLRRYAEQGRPFMSAREVAEDSGLPEGVIRWAIDRLEADGLVDSRRMPR